MDSLFRYIRKVIKETDNILFLDNILLDEIHAVNISLSSVYEASSIGQNTELRQVTYMESILNLFQVYNSGIYINLFICLTNISVYARVVEMVSNRQFLHDRRTKYISSFTIVFIATNSS